jgi:hypothetical protein
MLEASDGATPPSSSSDATPNNGENVNHLRSPRHEPVDSDLNKITKLDGNTDISDSRNSSLQHQSGSNYSNSNNSDQQTTPSPGGTQ